MKQTFAVIGLGRFGGSVLKKLANTHQEVLGVDSNPEIVQEYMHIATHTVIADGQDEDALRDLDIASFDHVIVAIGHNIQASILTTILVKDLGAKSVIAKAENDIHAKVLKKIGADMIIHPEAEMGRRLAHQLMTPNILNYIDLNNDYSLAEILITDHEFDNKSLAESGIRYRYGLNIIAIKRKDNNIIVSPTPDEKIYVGDVLSIVGRDVDIDKLDDRNHRE